MSLVGNRVAHTFVAPRGRQALRSREAVLAALSVVLSLVLLVRTGGLGSVAPVAAIAATGLTFVIVTGGIDLSVGAVVLLASVVFDTGLPVALAVAAAVVVGLLCGLVNGVLVATSRLPPAIITLGMFAVVKGIALGLTGGMAPSVRTGADLGMSSAVWMAALVAVVAHFVLTVTKFGRHTLFVGSNASAAELAGIRVHRVKATAYAVSGTLAGLAGVLATSYPAGDRPGDVFSFELIAIGAVVVGGARLFGGRGTILGTVLGVVVLTLVADIMISFQVSEYWQLAAQGTIIVVAALHESRARRPSGRRS